MPKELKLVRKETGKKAQPYIYEIWEGDKILCSRGSINSGYVACYVIRCIRTRSDGTVEDHGFDASFFFGSEDMIGKNSSRRCIPYGIARITN